MILEPGTVENRGVIDVGARYSAKLGIELGGGDPGLSHDALKSGCCGFQIIIVREDSTHHRVKVRVMECREPSRGSKGR